MRNRIMELNNRNDLKLLDLNEMNEQLTEKRDGLAPEVFSSL